MATALDALDSGSHIVASDDLYGGTFRLFDRVRRRSANLDFSYVDLTDPKDLERAIKPNTRMVWIETPSNPLLKLIDLEAVAKIARKRKIIRLAITPLRLRGFNARSKLASISSSIPPLNISMGIPIWWAALLWSAKVKNSPIKSRFCKIRLAQSLARSTVFLCCAA